jgi:peptide/nickel transport system substrate-binding protein
MSQSYWAKTLKEQRLTRRRTLALAGGAGMAALIAACGSDSGGSDNGSALTNESTPKPVGTPQQGGHFGYWFSSVANNNPVVNFYHGNRLDGIQVYDRLLTVRADKRRYNLEAAQKVEQPDDLTVIFKLKPGMVYQDIAPVSGRPVKASDVVASENYVRDLPNAENNSFQRLFLDSAEAPDDETVIFHMKQGDAYLYSLAHLGFGTGQMIIPPELYPNLDSGQPVGSGPYTLADYSFNTRYLYKRFDKYHEKGLPYIDEREYVGVVDAVAQEAAFRSGQLTFWTPPNTLVDRLMGELDKNQFNNRSYLSSMNQGINVNMDPSKGKKPWHDVRVREAMYRLTRPEQFVDLVFSSKAVPTTAPTLHENLDEYLLKKDDVEKYLKYDVAAAKQLLSAAAYDTSQEHEIICSVTSSTNAGMAEVWQQQLAEGDFKVRVTNLPFAEWLPKRIATGNFELIVGGQPGGDTPYRAIRNQDSDTLDQYNHVGLYDKDLDAMIEKSEHMTDHEAQVDLVKQIQMEAIKQYTMSYIVLTPQATDFLSSKLQDWEVNPVASPNYQAAAYMLT